MHLQSSNDDFSSIADRVFPGNLDLSIPFDEQLNNILSELFKNKSKAVTDDVSVSILFFHDL